MNKLQIIIAEDNEELRESMVDYFKNDDKIEVVYAADNGIKAVEMIEELKPHIVILDIVMPELDGFDVMAKVRLEKPPKYIIVSQLVGDAFVMKAMRLGASYYMAKPVNLDTLRMRITEFADKSEIKPVITFTDKEEKYFSADTFKARAIRSLDEKIANIFISVGIPAHIKGYQFLREAIKMAISTPEIINCITKKLYPSIADKFDTSPSKVERAIRHAIEVAWNRGKIENINNIFGIKIYSANEKPTNGEFIALVADKMLLEGA
ncbi:MAG: sporulation transcription factor Spo0A [Christensenellales bacterium]|jgi:two-component system response regulator (stage 0 sporulation protein A)